MSGKTRTKKISFTKPCKNEDELHAWVQQFCHINVPRKAVCAHHGAPFDYLKGAYLEPSKDIVVWAPRGGGKTRLGAVATLLDLVHKPGCSVRIIAGSLEQSMKMWEHLVEELENAKQSQKQLKFKLANHRVRMSNGSVAAVLAQSQTAVRGLRVQKLRCDEVEMFDPEVWDAAQLVTRTRPKTGDEPEISGVVEVFSTLHRPWGLMNKIVDSARARGTKVVQWCLMEVLEKCPERRDCDTCPLLEECGRRAKIECDGFFSIDDAIAMKSRVSRETWEAEMLCLRPSTKGCVFPSFKTETHVKEFDDSIGESWLAIDFGFHNPFVCLWITKSTDGQIHVLDEYIQSGKTMHEHIHEIESRPWRRSKLIACDPAGASPNEQTARSNIDLLKHSGYTVRHRSSRIVEGVELVRAALRSGTNESHFSVHPRCARLIRALQAYRYPETPGELPLKDGTHDHLIDALRYFFINASVSHKAHSRRY